MKPSYFESSQLSLTYSDLYTEFINEKKLFIDETIKKINLIKEVVAPLYNLASAAVS